MGIGNSCVWLIECGVNVSLTLCVLLADGKSTGPSSKESYNSESKTGRTNVHTSSFSHMLTCTLGLRRVESYPSVVTTLIGLCNCLAKHCGKQHTRICPFASNHFLNMDSHRHDSTIQEIAEHLCIRVCLIMRVLLCDWL